MRLKQTKAIQSNFSTQCDDWYIFGVIGLEIVKNASNHAVFLKSVMKTLVFRQSQHRTLCAVLFYLQEKFCARTCGFTAKIYVKSPKNEEKRKLNLQFVGECAIIISEKVDDGNRMKRDV